MSSWLNQVIRWNGNKFFVDPVHHSKALLLSSLLKKLPPEFLELFCRTDILLLIALFAHNYSCSPIDSLQDVAAFLGVGDTTLWNSTPSWGELELYRPVLWFEALLI